MIFQAWCDLDLDVLIAPGFGTPSMPVKDPARLVPLTAYTNVYNVLDLPAGSLPVEVYTQDDQVRSFVFLNPMPNTVRIIRCTTSMFVQHFLFHL